MEYKLNDVMVERPNKTVYFEDGKTIKLFRENYSKAQILNEALITARIEEDTDLVIPKLQEVVKINNRWAIVLDHIYGKTLENLLIENPQKEDEYLNLFVDIQLEIQSKRVPMLGRIKEKFKRKLTETTLMDNDTKYELLQRLEGMKNQNALCHGDFNMSNIIIDDKNNWHVIDWAHATQGNPSADSARSFLLLNMQGKETLAEKYLNLFAEKSKIQKNEIQRWIPIVAGTQFTKGIEEEKEFLSHWLDVLDFQ